MRILHTSDWHLGRIFQNIHLTDDQSYILDQIHLMISEYKVDCIVIAGDIYDRAVPPPEAVKLLDDTLYRFLLDHKKPLVMIAGNHDSPDRLGFGSRLFVNHGLHLYGAFEFPVLPLSLSDRHGEILFYPIPYCEPSIVRERSSVDSIKEHNESMQIIINSINSNNSGSSRRICCGHAFVNGGISQESERPLSIGAAGAVEASNFAGFNCTLLGHLHRRQSFDSMNIHYCGSILPYSFSEIDHHKSVSIIDIDDRGVPSYEFVNLIPRRPFRIIEGKMSNILSDSASDKSPDDYLLVRLTDKEPVLDAINRLRQPYPNVLAIERPGLEYSVNEKLHSGIDHRSLSDSDLFSAFYSQVTDEILSDAQSAFFREIAERILISEREVQK